MAISHDLGPLWLSEGSTCHFGLKIQKYDFGEKSKVVYGMLDMAIWLLETENTLPKRCFEALSFLNFRKSEKIYAEILKDFWPKTLFSRFLTKHVFSIFEIEPIQWPWRYGGSIHMCLGCLSPKYGTSNPSI